MKGLSYTSKCHREMKDCIEGRKKTEADRSLRKLTTGSSQLAGQGIDLSPQAEKLAFDLVKMGAPADI